MECKEKLEKNLTKDASTSNSSKSNSMQTLLKSSELSSNNSNVSLKTSIKQSSSPSQTLDSSQRSSIAQVSSPKTYDVNNDPATDDLMKDILYEIGVTVTNGHEGSKDSVMMNQDIKDCQNKNVESLLLSKGIEKNEALSLSNTNDIKDDNEERLDSFSTKLESNKEYSIGKPVDKNSTQSLIEQHAEPITILKSKEAYETGQPFQPLDSIKRSLASLTAPNKLQPSRVREFRNHRSTLSSSRITIGEVLSKVPVSDVSVPDKDLTMLGSRVNLQDGLGAEGHPASNISLMENTELRPTSPSYPPPPAINLLKPTSPSYPPNTYYPSSPTHTPISFHDSFSSSYVPRGFMSGPTSPTHISSSYVPRGFMSGPTSPTHPPPQTINYPASTLHQPLNPFSCPSNFSQQATLQPSPFSIHGHVNYNDIPRSPTHPPPNPLLGPSSPTYPPPNFLHGPISPTHPPPDLPPIPINSIHSPMYPSQNYIHGPSSPTHPPPNAVYGPTSPTHPPPPPIAVQMSSPFFHGATVSDQQTMPPVTPSESPYQQYTPQRFLNQPPSVPHQQSHQSSSGILYGGGKVSSESTNSESNKSPHILQGTQMEQTDSSITQKTSEEGSGVSKGGKVGMTVGMSDLLTFTFQHEHFPSSVNMARLAKMMGVQWAQVRNWFTNRRLEIKKAGVYFRDKTLNYCPYCRIHLKAPKEQKTHLFDPEHIKSVLGVEFQGAKDDPDTKKKIFWTKFPEGVDAFSKISGAKILAVGYSAENGNVKSEDIGSEDVKESFTKDEKLSKVEMDVKKETPDVKQEKEEIIATSLAEETESKMSSINNITEENPSTTEEITMTYVSVNKRMAGGKVNKPVKTTDNLDFRCDKVLKDKEGSNSQGIGFNKNINQEPKQRGSTSISPRTKANMREGLKRGETTTIDKEEYKSKREILSDDQNSVIHLQPKKSKTTHSVNTRLPQFTGKYKESKLKPESSHLYRKVLKQSILCQEDNLIVGYQCPNCPKVFHTEWLMMKHSLTHFEYQCGICENSFVSLADLKKHLLEHLTLAFEGDYYSQFSCKICRCLQCHCYEQDICKPADTPNIYSKPQTAKRTKKTFITKPNTCPNDHLKVTFGSYKRRHFPNQYKEPKGFRKPHLLSSTKNMSDKDNDNTISKQRLLKNIQPLPNESSTQKQSCPTNANISKQEESVVIKDEENSQKDFSKKEKSSSYRPIDFSRKENTPVFVPRSSMTSKSKDNRNYKPSVQHKEVFKKNTSSESVHISPVPQISDEYSVRKKRGRKPGGVNGKNTAGKIYKDADYYYLCEMCDSTFLSKAELNEHMFFHRLKSRSRRGDKRPIRGAPLEGSEEPNIKRIKVDQDVETIDIGGFERFKCPLCKGHFASIQDLNRHRTQAHAQDEIKPEGGTIELLKCSYCDKLYRRERELRRHLKHGCKGPPAELMDMLNEGKSLHTIKLSSGKLPFTVVLQNALSDDNHILNMQEGPLECLYCGRSVKRMREMKRHVSMFCRNVPKDVKIKVNKGVSLLDLGFKIQKNEIHSSEIKNHNRNECNDSIVIKDEPIEAISEPTTSKMHSNLKEKTNKNVSSKSLPKNIPQQSKWEKEALRSMTENSSEKTLTVNITSKTPYRYGQCPYCKMFYTKQYILNHMKEKCFELSAEDKHKIKGVTSIEQIFEILSIEEEVDDPPEAIVEESPSVEASEAYVTAELDKDDEDYDPVQDARENNVSILDIQAKITQNKISRQENTCKKCGESYSSQAKLIAHSSIHHGPKKNLYRCKLCNEKMQKYRQLREHVWEHTKESPYRCHVCKSTFRVSDHLIWHLNTQHEYFEIHEKNLYKWLPGKFGRYRTITDKGNTETDNLICNDIVKSDSDDNKAPENESKELSDTSEAQEIKDITEYDIDMVISEITKTERIKLPGNKHIKISPSDSKMLIQGLLQTKKDLINFKKVKNSNTTSSETYVIESGKDIDIKKNYTLNDSKTDDLLKEKVENKRTCKSSKSPRKSLSLEDSGELFSTLDALDSVVETVQINDSDLR